MLGTPIQCFAAITPDATGHWATISPGAMIHSCGYAVALAATIVALLAVTGPRPLPGQSPTARDTLIRRATLAPLTPLPDKAATVPLIDRLTRDGGVPNYAYTGEPDPRDYSTSAGRPTLTLDHLVRPSIEPRVESRSTTSWCTWTARTSHSRSSASIGAEASIRTEQA
jgi:hypothetical protein